jgi:hypothetical protein
LLFGKLILLLLLSSKQILHGRYHSLKYAITV